ncbi:MAG: DEAD/DEAH box helicase [Candidatus Delongbacteria bacterium]|nr:DEAD/DEAH box helicase [Candidatus Delongbacteria bacterium]MBN2835791.1 DEAD/DEAH box helicase [Candidatus Delongbacteria bacterium]
MSFSELGLRDSYIKILNDLEFKTPYPIQKMVIPLALEGKDILGIAKTGSGKTLSYVLPILMNLENDPTYKTRNIKSLILVPTRELAVQVFEVFKQFNSATSQPIKTYAVHGGVSINPQMMALQGVKILIATPGRLLELLQSNALHLSLLKILVIDEADKMLNLGFEDEMNKILSLLPDKRQNLLFSATLNEKMENINKILLHEPAILKIEEVEENIELITQKAYLVQEERKGPLLRYIIKNNDMNQVLVFTSSIRKADNVAEKLTKNGINAISTHSQKSQKARTDALAKFKSGKVRVLVTTDLLSRGIDIEFLPFVINYELPRSPKDFIHRIGRTGRAESDGMAISLITSEDLHHFNVIQKKMKKKVDLIESDKIDLHGF